MNDWMKIVLNNNNNKPKTSQYNHSYLYIPNMHICISFKMGGGIELLKLITDNVKQLY